MFVHVEFTLLFLFRFVFSSQVVDQAESLAFHLSTCKLLVIYIYIHIYIYIYIYICVCVCVCVCVCMYVFTLLCVPFSLHRWWTRPRASLSRTASSFTYTYLYICLSIYQFKLVCMYVCMYSYSCRVHTVNTVISVPFCFLRL